MRQRQHKLRGQLAVIREEETLAEQIFRKPTAFAAVHVDDGDESVVVVYVACDDGTVYTLDESSKYWDELPPIPGSRADVEAPDDGDDA